MKKITTKKLQKILADHKKWLETLHSLEPEGKRADLSNIDLSGKDLRGAHLNDSILTSADLRNADLSNAELYKADLSGVDFTSANLRNASLTYADLRSANLNYADLRGANLYNVNLRAATLYRANVEGQSFTDMKQSTLYVLQNCPIKDVKKLRELIINGNIVGSAYTGDCACLIGSLRNIAQLSKEMPNSADAFAKSHISYYQTGLDNKCEQLFYQINKGDTPDNNYFSKIALEVVDFYISALQEATINDNKN